MSQRKAPGRLYNVLLNVHSELCLYTQTEVTVTVSYNITASYTGLGQKQNKTSVLTDINQHNYKVQYSLMCASVGLVITQSIGLIKMLT